jgi:hypothetical protein
MLFKRSLFNKDTQFRLSIINEDEIFMPRFILRCKRIQAIDNALIFHLIREGQVTRRGKTFSNVYSYWTVANELLREIDLNYSDDVTRKLKSLIDCFYNLTRHIYFYEINKDEQAKKSQLTQPEQILFEHIIERFVTTQKHISDLEKEISRINAELSAHMGIKCSAKLTIGNIKRRIMHGKNR